MSIIIEIRLNACKKNIKKSKKKKKRNTVYKNIS